MAAAPFDHRVRTGFAHHTAFSPVAAIRSERLRGAIVIVSAQWRQRRPAAPPLFRGCILSYCTHIPHAPISILVVQCGTQHALLRTVGSVRGRSTVWFPNNLRVAGSQTRWSARRRRAAAPPGRGAGALAGSRAARRARMSSSRRRRRPVRRSIRRSRWPVRSSIRRNSRRPRSSTRGRIRRWTASARSPRPSARRGEHLRQNDQGAIAQYADKAAERVEQFTGQLRGKDVQTIVRDVERYARQQPAVFLGGAFVLGLLGARFLKSTAQREDDSEGGEYGGDRGPDYGRGYGYDRRPRYDNYRPGYYAGSYRGQYDRGNESGRYGGQYTGGAATGGYGRTTDRLCRRGDDRRVRRAEHRWRDDRSGRCRWVTGRARVSAVGLSGARRHD